MLLIAYSIIYWKVLAVVMIFMCFNELKTLLNKIKEEREDDELDKWFADNYKG